MRFRNWAPNKHDEKFIGLGMDKLKEAAETVADDIRSKCPEDTGKLKNSVRIVEKKESWGFEATKRKNIRVYVGHYKAWYAQVVEYRKPFMRPAWRTSLPKLKQIIGAK